MVVKLIFEMKGSSNKVKRIYACIGPNDFEAISVVYSITSNEFRLKSLTLNLACSMLGPIVI